MVYILVFDSPSLVAVSLVKDSSLSILSYTDLLPYKHWRTEFSNVNFLFIQDDTVE